MKKAMIVIAGPTASGKSKLAMQIAKKFDGEIINADSRTVYKEMDIATSKPTTKDLSSVPHHLFSIISPEQPFSLANYKKLAEKTIFEIQKRDKIPLLVGGTGLYVDAIVYDFNMAETPPDFEIRNQLNQLPTEELIAKLKELDPDEAQKIDLKNRRKIIRAFEIIKSSNGSETKEKTRKEKPDNVLYLAIDLPREKLYERIDKRIDEWLVAGLTEETKHLILKYKFDLPSMSSIGYKEISEALVGEITINEAAKIMKKRTRNYAKRQLTWFKRNKDVVWVKNMSEAEKAINSFFESMSS
jgi:tRNA dimethylallyltransferase